MKPSISTGSRGFGTSFHSPETMARALHLLPVMNGNGNASRDLGNWCVEAGIATAEEIDSSLRIQRSAQLSGKPPPRLEEILVARGILTPHQVAKALAATRPA